MKPPSRITHVARADLTTTAVSEKLATIIDWLLRRADRIDRLLYGKVLLNFGGGQLRSVEITEGEQLTTSG